MKRLWSTRKWLLGLAVVLAVTLLGSGTPAPVMAHDESTISVDSGIFLDSPTLGRLAAVLEMTPTELGNQLQTGKTLATIAEERNVPSDTLIEALIAPYAEQIVLEVKYGYITQEQAQCLLDTERQRASYFLLQDLSATEGNTYCYYGYFGHCGGYMMGGGYSPQYGSRIMGPGMMWGWGSYYNNPALAPPTTSGGTSFPSQPWNWARGWGMMGGGMMGGGRMGRW